VIFLTTVVSYFNIEVEENDQEKLIEAMTYVRDVRLSQDRIDNLFVPLKGIIGLLKTFKISMPDETIELLEMIPFNWEDTNKVTLNARESLGPLQSLQQEKVREKTENFKSVIQEFCSLFHEEAPFQFEVGHENAYNKINSYHIHISALEQEALEVGASQELFELAVTPWRSIKECRVELGYLKLAWDHVQLVSDIFQSFRNTLWSAVDVEAMTDQTKKLQKEVKMLNKAVHKWDVHAGLTSLVAAMSVSLPLVNDLRDEAMRNRHWSQLMSVCGKTFVMDEKLQLDALLRLELDKFQDSVSEIVERARAEIKIDLQLQKIITTWSGLALFYQPFKATGVQILIHRSCSCRLLRCRHRGHPDRPIPPKKLLEGQPRRAPFEGSHRRSHQGDPPNPTSR